MENCISVIIPVYRAKKTLGGFFEKLKDDPAVLEWIFVDDASGDGTLELLYSLKKDWETENGLSGKVRIFHLPENKGPGGARNEGILHAQGTCVAFLDADDRVEDGYYTEQLKAMEETGRDLIVSGYIQDTYNKKEKLISQCRVGTKGMHIANGLDRIALLDHEKLFSYCYNKLYRKDLITENRILFPELKMNEDFFFNCACFACIDRFGLQETKWYHYRKCAGEGLTGVYLKEYPQIIRKRLEGFESLMHRRKVPAGRWEGPVYAVHIKHLFSAAVRMFSPESGYGRKERKAAIRELNGDPQIRYWLGKMQRDSSAMKLFYFVFRTGNDSVLYLAAGSAAFMQRHVLPVFEHLKAH